MNEKLYNYIEFNQYNSKSHSDKLIMFAAKAKDLYSWAGIPRKGWHIRMLFQRPITATREEELTSFWKNASKPSDGDDLIVGPTAIIIAIQDEIVVKDKQICLDYKSEIDLLDENTAKVTSDVANALWNRVVNRLDSDQKHILEERKKNPFEVFPDVANDYVFEFALQLQQLKTNAERFFEENNIDSDSQVEIIQAMEAILRPAIVVDGQHRLFGAAHIEEDVILPVVAIPHCPWTEQVYQFVVINEKAQRVDQSLLSDIFGSSITHKEQVSIRKRLARSNVEVESRIAATIANREPQSPFRNMVVVKMTGTAPADIRPYLSDRTIRVLIDGSSQKYSAGWRTNEEFYNIFVSPTIPNKEDWDSWGIGKWRDYWFEFWNTVKEFYNKESVEKGVPPLWIQTEQTNLTKAVTLRQMQTLFMINCVESIKRLDENREILVEALGNAELADKKIIEQKKDRALPSEINEFKNFVINNFLKNGIPHKVFSANWKNSLDDADGQQELWDTLTKAYTKSRKGETFHVRGQIFEASDND